MIENVSGAEIYRKLCVAYGEENVMKRRSVRIDNKIQRGRTNVQDEPREGRPSRSINSGTVAIVRELLVKDRQLTVTDIRHEMATQYVCMSTSIAHPYK